MVGEKALVRVDLMVVSWAVWRVDSSAAKTAGWLAWYWVEKKAGDSVGR